MLTPEEYNDIIELETRIDLGGNDGADIYDYEAMAEHLLEKYNLNIEELKKQYLFKQAKSSI